jgi:hypothetical protein
MSETVSYRRSNTACGQLDQSMGSGATPAAMGARNAYNWILGNHPTDNEDPRGELIVRRSCLRGFSNLH